MAGDEYAPTEPAPRCTDHDGEHAVIDGSCFAFGAQVPRPLLFSRRSWACECGIRVSGVIERKTMRRFLIDERTSAEHLCTPPVRVKLDEEALAEGIALALDTLMERRKQARGPQSSSPPRPPQSPPPPEPPNMTGSSILDRYTE